MIAVDMPLAVNCGIRAISCFDSVTARDL